MPSANCFSKFGKDECVKQHLIKMEMVEYVKHVMRDVNGSWLGYKHVVVLDLADLGMSHGRSSFKDGMRGMINTDQFLYPENLYQMICVNTPLIVRSMWAMVRPWLHPITAEKIKIKSVPSEALREVVDDMGQVPREYGGKGALGAVVLGGVKLPDSYTRPVDGGPRGRIFGR
jgi:hypothetical protein